MVSAGQRAGSGSIRGAQGLRNVAHPCNGLLRLCLASVAVKRSVFIDGRKRNLMASRDCGTAREAINTQLNMTTRSNGGRNAGALLYVYPDSTFESLLVNVWMNSAFLAL